MVVVRKVRGKKSFKDWRDLNDNWGKAVERNNRTQNSRVAGARPNHQADRAFQTLDNLFQNSVSWHIY